MNKSKEDIPTPILVMALLFAGTYGIFIVIKESGIPMWVAIVGSSIILLVLAILGLSKLFDKSAKSTT